MKQAPMNKSLMLVASVALASVVALGGCRGDTSDKPPRQFFPDMDDQPKYKAQSTSTFFEEYVDEETGDQYGRSQRPPVPGTVAFGRQPHTGPVLGVDFADRNEFLRDDPATNEGRVYRAASNGALEVNEETGQLNFDWVDRMPVRVDASLLELGQKKYNIYCISCHGGTGAGDGLVGRRWSYPLPNFHDDRYQLGGELGQDGYIFHVIRNGVPNPGGPYEYRMMPYGRKLTIRETWSIVAYVRALQKAQSGSLNMLPESQRLELERRRGAATPAGGAAMSPPADTPEPNTSGAEESTS
jgi:mono/diheme cytochrome c family protein